MTPYQFPLPSTFGEQETNIDKKFCIVSIVSHSAQHTDSDINLTSLLLSQRRLQMRATPVSIENDQTSNYMNLISAFVDTDQNVVYLRLSGLVDSRQLLKQLKTVEVYLKRKGFEKCWQSLTSSYARAVLFLFHVSHIVLVTHADQNFDIGLVNFYKTLNGIRQKIQSNIADVLRKTNGQTDYLKSYSRIASPRALFVFTRLKTASAKPNSDALYQFSVKKFEHAMEDQIYRILRKSRVITNNSANSMFAVPANQEYVYCFDPTSADCEPPADYTADKSVLDSIEILRQLCTGQKIESFLKTPSIDTTNLESDGKLSHSFKTFVLQHVETALTKGLNDNVGRFTAPTCFELVTLRAWQSISNAVHALFLADGEEPSPSEDHFQQMDSTLNVTGKFIDSRCKKIFPLAVTEYQTGLPFLYNTAYHKHKLKDAFAFFEFHIRGEAAHKYYPELRAQCEAYWMKGHQACEQLSVLGNPCLNQMHKLPGESEGDHEGGATVLNHCSQITAMSTCNCGRQQATRDDPFTCKEANFDFYERVAEVCCRNLDSKIEMPIFAVEQDEEKSEEDSVPKENGAHMMAKSLTEGDGASFEQKDSLAPKKSLAAIGEISLNSQRMTPAYFHKDMDDGYHPEEGENKDDVISKNESKSESTAKIINQIDDGATSIKTITRSCPMMTLHNRPGLLPDFPSWSLICLGQSNVYSHNKGIQDQPGFLNGSNYLLPWDVPVSVTNPESLPAPVINPSTGSRWADTAAGRNKEQAQTPTKAIPIKVGDTISVKLFVGVEYECPRGHRFMCIGPDKIFKFTGTRSQFTDTANNMANMEMPLYTPCNCSRSSSKQLLAQLMRLHVVTPKAPVTVSVNPRVRPVGHVHCPVFVTGHSEPVRLSPASYWVLRLPYVYMDEKQSYLPAEEYSPTTIGKLLRDVFSVVESKP